MAAYVERVKRLTPLPGDVGRLVRIVGRLRVRLGLERTLSFGVRGVGASAVIVIALAVAAWLMPIGNWPTSAWIAAVPLGVALGLGMLRWPSDREAALAADSRLALEERLATALELARRSFESGHEGGRFDRLQVADAVARAQRAPHAWLSLDRRIRREGLVAAALSLLAAISLALPGLPPPGLPMADSGAGLRSGDPLPAPLERAQPPTAELTVADSQPIVQTQIDADLAPHVQQQQAEHEALDALAQAMGRISAGQPAADAIQRGDFSAARDQLASLGEEADQLSEAAKQQLGQALQQAANATAGTDRALADRERQAAQALGRNTYADQRQAMHNLADQVARSGARTASADQLARDAGRLQQQSAKQGSGASGRGSGTGQGAQGQASGNPADAGQPAATAGGAQAGAGAGQSGAPGVGTGVNPDVLGDPSARLDTAGQRVEVPTKLGTGPGVRPADGTEDQNGTDPAAATHSVSEHVQTQRTGQVVPEQNLVPGEQRPVVQGYFR